MDAQEIKKNSKFLSLILRHQPEKIGIQLDEAGWVDVDELLAAIQARRRRLSRPQLEIVVQTNDKQRFEFNADGTRIRARQGHSVAVDLGYAAAVPPAVLFHGTPVGNTASISRGGLLKGNRHHVHLHEEVGVALTVGRRRGRPVVFVVDARAMHAAGYEFFVTSNQVWLTDHVPAEFLRLLEEGDGLGTSK